METVWKEFWFFFFDGVRNNLFLNFILFYFLWEIAIEIEEKSA